jgi:hypothetical protein
MNDVAPELFRRSRIHSDVEDLALEFLENEVGRFDWSRNWPKIKASGSAHQKVQEWLNALNSDANPNEIISYLDKMLIERTGRWL